jgi:hypothetical protein
MALAAHLIYLFMDAITNLACQREYAGIFYYVQAGANHAVY